MSRIHQIVAERIIRPLKRPVWYKVHSLTGLRMQMATHIHDAFMFSASFRAPLEKVRERIPSPKLMPIECSPGMTEIIVQANEFRHIDILYPYNEVAISVPVSYQTGSNPTPSSGFWYLHLPVSTEDGRWGGVENYGYPKFVAEIEFDLSSDYPQCTLRHNGNIIFTLKVKALPTLFKEWKYDNITMRDGRLLHSSLSVKGQRGMDEMPGGASISFGDHPIALELQSLKMESRSFRHEYMPEAEAILSVGREIKEMI
ncbi:MAG: acetoacetate decarboxylase family protein [Bacteroidales bacterium]